ncbi:MAG: DUF6128 domain-containing protein [Eubacteriales bacterium]
MKQSICYLYEYEHHKQSKNVGFLKCIFSKDKVTFQIHGKGLECDKFMDLEMFLFTSDKEGYETDYAGAVEGIQGTVNYIVTVEEMNIERFNEYDGIILEAKSHKKYVATWKKKEPYVEHKKISETVEEPFYYEDNSDVEDENNVVIQAETKLQEVVREEIEEEIDDTEHAVTKYEKIDRQEISGLPQREWKLANNNFLLHGYSNYHHLMLIRENERLFLGVPGIYHDNEEAAAKSFGFPLFHEVDVNRMDLEEKECDMQGKFGYWCRPVSERRRTEQRYGRRSAFYEGSYQTS